MTLPRCPRCAATVEPSWDWCQQCGYDPEHLRPEGVLVGAPAEAEREAENGRGRRSRRKKAKATATVAVAPEPAPPVEPRPLPPRRPTETVYGPLPYDLPSSVAPVEAEELDDSEKLNRRFAIIALCVIVVGLALLVTTALLG